VEIFLIDVRKRAKIQIPLESIVSLEFKVCIFVFVRLFEHRIFEIVAFTQRAVTVIVVVHPLVHGGSLFADRFKSGMRV